MIPLEKRALEALHCISMRIASPGKRFRNDVTWRLEQDPEYKLTERQALYLWYLVDMYRRQIRDEELKRHGADRRLSGVLPEIYLEGDLRPPVGKPKTRAVRVQPTPDILVRDLPVVFLHCTPVPPAAEQTAFAFEKKRGRQC